MTTKRTVRLRCTVCLLPFALRLNPCFASAPVSSLPGVVDADSWKTSRHNPPAPVSPLDSKTYQILQSLNQIPEDQLNEKAGTAVPLLEQLRTEDGPRYLRLKTLVARADVRKTLNPSLKCVLAGLLAPRWDGFSLAGNLYLAAMQSANPDFRARAREKLIGFIQPVHLPILINILKVPGPNVLAFEVLQEVTGQGLDPNYQIWAAWWAQTHGKVDLVGHILSQSRIQLAQAQVRGFDQAAFWYLPEGISRASVPLAQRSSSDQKAIGRWAESAAADMKRYVEEWGVAKPMFERIVHQPDSRVTVYLKSLAADPGYGDYVSVVLGWRNASGALTTIQEAYRQHPTVGRALARGSLGDKSALQDLFKMIETHRTPLSYGIMDDITGDLASRLPALGVISAEQAFELLTHQRFGLVSAETSGEKKKAIKKARRWLEINLPSLTLDSKRGYYVIPAGN